MNIKKIREKHNIEYGHGHREKEKERERQRWTRRREGDQCTSFGKEEI